MEICARWKVPIWITSLGARMEEVNEAAHSCGGIALHDVIDDRFARKAIEKGADGLIAVAAGAGGHAGMQSPFALIREIRDWFDGPLLLSGAIATGAGVLAARAMGADLAYVGSVFIATEEANAVDEYKQMIVEGRAYRYNDFRALHGRIRQLPSSLHHPGGHGSGRPARGRQGDGFRLRLVQTEGVKEIWGAGQGIGAVRAVMPTAELIARIGAEYDEALAQLMGGAA